MKLTGNNKPCRVKEARQKRAHRTMSCLRGFEVYLDPGGAVAVVTLSTVLLRMRHMGMTRIYHTCISRKGLPLGGSATKNLLDECRDARDTGSVAGLGRSLDEKNGNPPAAFLSE